MHKLTRINIGFNLEMDLIQTDKTVCFPHPFHVKLKETSIPEIR